MLSIKNLDIQYVDEVVLTNASLDIGAGEIVLIHGKSGSGKTSLLNVLGMINSYNEECTYIYRDISIHKLSESQRSKLIRTDFSFVFQYNNFISSLTIAENLAIPLKIQNIKKANIESEIINISELLGIKSLLNRYPESLSGGQLQRAAIARAILKKPKVLFADEITSALDDKNSNEIKRLITKINFMYGTTIIIATHDDRLLDIATRVVKLEGGMLKMHKYSEPQLKEIKSELTVRNNNVKPLSFFSFYKRAIGRKKQLERFLIVISTAIIASSLFITLVFRCNFESAPFVKSQNNFANSLLLNEKDARFNSVLSGSGHSSTLEMENVMKELKNNTKLKEVHPNNEFYILPYNEVVIPEKAKQS